MLTANIQGPVPGCETRSPRDAFIARARHTGARAADSVRRRVLLPLTRILLGTRREYERFLLHRHHDEHAICR